jgi:hypothetical protein
MFVKSFQAPMILQKKLYTAGAALYGIVPDSISYTRSIKVSRLS